ncbi:hypothetical protein ACIQW9_07175 [Herminiimonas sp. NPDC097707]|uniref:hypothetical protein n=1 Tax=Herminiimonas sp. NPDC097707 TaxID=3364007 RepID=UPI00383B0245
MKNYQDTETGQLFAFEDGVDPFTPYNRNIPVTLSEDIKPKPNDSYVWHQGDWIKQEDAPPGYTQPVSSVPAYNPAWMAYLLPYTAVHRDEDSGLNVTLDQVNGNSYAGNKLAEVVAILPLGTPSGLPALISYDGAIAIPQCDDFPSNVDGIRKLNEILCSLLLGGVHTEVLHSKGLVIGILQDASRLFAFIPSIHSNLRSNSASISERLSPLMFPRVLMMADIQEAYCQGQQVVKAIHNFSPFFLLNGYTAMVYRNNSDALNNLWISVEQLTEHLWVEHYVKNKRAFPVRVSKRHEYLKQKNQLNNIWAKQELLLLSKIISKECHEALRQVRDKRNNLVHDGIVPDSQTVETLWGALPELIEMAAEIRPLGMRKIWTGSANNWGIPARTNFDEWVELAKKL